MDKVHYYAHFKDEKLKDSIICLMSQSSDVVEPGDKFWLQGPSVTKWQAFQVVSLEDKTYSFIMHETADIWGIFSIKGLH